MTKSAGWNFPDVSQLPERPEFPDPLRMFDGRPVTSAEMWERERKPELRALFQHYMYGYLPPAVPVTATVRRMDSNAIQGKATLKEISLHYGPSGCPPLELLLVVPNRRQGPAPVFVGLNFNGNHVLLDDPLIRIPTAWVRQNDCSDGNRASEKARGIKAGSWALEQTVERGYAVATCYYGDGFADRAYFKDGSFPYFVNVSGTELGPTDCGAIGYWAWTIHRLVDYLASDADIDAKNIAVMGHSRLGKAALLAAAFDERIALAIPHQSGCGGSAPSRNKNPEAENVQKINAAFPYWFNGNYKRFNAQPERLPFDQHCLLALCAPRPVLLSNGVDDVWCNPPGTFDTLSAAKPVYEVLGSKVPNLSAPQLGKLIIGGPLGYYLRAGGHVTDPDYWRTFVEFADGYFRRAR
jgi:hypothetical protein